MKISQATIDDAIQEAITDGSFMAVRLEKENPEIVFTVGLVAFLRVIERQAGDARVLDVKSALTIYARQRARPS